MNPSTSFTGPLARSLRLRVYTCAEVAYLLDLPPRTVRNRIYTGKLRAFKQTWWTKAPGMPRAHRHERLYIAGDELEQYIRTQEQAYREQMATRTGRRAYWQKKQRESRERRREAARGSFEAPRAGAREQDASEGERVSTHASEGGPDPLYGASDPQERPPDIPWRTSEPAQAADPLFCHAPVSRGTLRGQRGPHAGPFGRTRGPPSEGPEILGIPPNLKFSDRPRGPLGVCAGALG